LDKKYGHKGLSILAFPSDEFGGQEIPSDQIQEFVTSKFGESGIILMDKINVNGPNTHPVYAFLKGGTPKTSDIRWNFATKFLVSPQGEVTRHDKKNPADLEPEIQAMLASTRAKSDL